MARETVYRIEGDVKKTVKRLLTGHGWFWWMPAANGYGRGGVSDFLAIKDGVFIAVETKFGRNALSPLQKDFMSKFTEQRGLGFVVDETSIAAFANYLNCFDHIARARDDMTTPDANIERLLGESLATLTARLG